MKKMLFLLALAFSASVLADAATTVMVEKPFARKAIKAQRNSAAFMTLHNNGPAVAVVAAESPVAEIVELHTHVHDNGVMRMRKIDKIELPAGGEVTLQPGGLHVMLLGLKQDLNEGERISVTLKFSDGSSKTIEAPVRMVMRPKMKGMKHDMKGMDHSKMMKMQAH